MTPAELAALTERPGPGPHLTSITVDGAAVETLADLPPLRDRLLFVGLNPSPVSVEAGHYHQGRLGQTFWRRLMLAGVIPPGTPIEDADDALVAAGHGITDLLKVPTPRDTATDAQLTSGVGPLWQKIAIWRPAAVVFIYKRAAETAAGRVAQGAVGCAARCRPRRPAVRPDARAVRTGRVGRRGDQLPAQPQRSVAGRPRLGARPRGHPGRRRRTRRGRPAQAVPPRTPRARPTDPPPRGSPWSRRGPRPRSRPTAGSGPRS